MDGRLSRDLGAFLKIQCWCQIFPEDPPSSLPIVFKTHQQTKIAHSYVDTFYHSALYLDMYLCLPLDSSRAEIIIFIFVSLLHDT